MRAVLAALALLLCAVPARSEEGAEIESWFPRLREGMWVKVEGELMAAGFLEATEIKILDGELDEWQIETYVASVDSAGAELMTTLGVRVLATPKTQMKGHQSKGHTTFAFVGADDQIEAEGKPQKDGALLADELEVERSKKKRPDFVPKNEHEVRARIERVDAANLQVILMGLTVQLSDKTRNKTPFVE